MERKGRGEGDSKKKGEEKRRVAEQVWPYSVLFLPHLPEAGSPKRGEGRNGGKGWTEATLLLHLTDLQKRRVEEKGRKGKEKKGLGSLLGTTRADWGKGEKRGGCEKEEKGGRRVEGSI